MEQARELSALVKNEIESDKRTQAVVEGPMYMSLKALVAAKEAKRRMQAKQDQELADFKQKVEAEDSTEAQEQIRAFEQQTADENARLHREHEELVAKMTDQLKQVISDTKAKLEEQGVELEEQGVELEEQGVELEEKHAELKQRAEHAELMGEELMGEYEQLKQNLNGELIDPLIEEATQQKPCFSPKLFGSLSTQTFTKSSNSWGFHECFKMGQLISEWA